MSQPRGVSEDLVSELSADPDMIELVEMFVQELPGKAEALERSLAEGDWDSLAKLAHQLKGSAGSHGFPSITERAARVEQNSRDGDALQNLSPDVGELADMCRHARATRQLPSWDGHCWWR